jgi:hypothetical protein
MEGDIDEARRLKAEDVKKFGTMNVYQTHPAVLRAFRGHLYRKGLTTQHNKKEGILHIFHPATMKQSEAENHVRVGTNRYGQSNIRKTKVKMDHDIDYKSTLKETHIGKGKIVREDDNSHHVEVEGKVYKAKKNPAAKVGDEGHLHHIQLSPKMSYYKFTHGKKSSKYFDVPSGEKEVPAKQLSHKYHKIAVNKYRKSLKQYKAGNITAALKTASDAVEYADHAHNYAMTRAQKDRTYAAFRHCDDHLHHVARKAKTNRKTYIDVDKDVDQQISNPNWHVRQSATHTRLAQGARDSKDQGKFSFHMKMAQYHQNRAHQLGAMKGAKQ